MFSVPEQKLLCCFVEERLFGLVSPNAIYRLAAERAFREDMRGPAVEALRRCMVAWEDCSPLRGTSAWDRLCFIASFKAGDTVRVVAWTDDEGRPLEQHPDVTIGTVSVITAVNTDNCTYNLEATGALNYYASDLEPV